MTPETPRRFERNAPGAFYTTGGCTSCGAPEAEAPELLAPLDDENYDTYFVRQPQTAEEVERACSAVEACCLSALRYAGTDPLIIRRLGNRPEFCDHLLREPPHRFAWESDDQWRDAERAWRTATRPWWHFWHT